MALLDQWGNPIDMGALRREQAGPTLTGIRQPVGGHPASGLTPPRLARLLREAEEGQPVSYLELAEDMEERDLHYAAVLGVRKRQVAGLEISVEAASDSAADIAAADLVRSFLDRDELADELIDILDAIGKGWSATEIIWETSARQWQPVRLEWRDPRHFDFDRETRRELRLRGGGGQLETLSPFKWIRHFAKAKSGLPVRGGLARPVTWGYMFKSFSIKDWAVFLEAYGQPMRIGKWGPGASEADKDLLMAALRNLGTDAAAAIPDSMKIEFLDAKLIPGNHELFMKNADWWDRQVSKIVLGQTGTTDGQVGGSQTGKVHDGVRDDIEKADCRQLAATLNRDLVRPYIDLNMGPQKAYPRIRIGRPDEVDIDKLVDNVDKLVRIGMKVGQSTMRDKLGLPDPAPEEELLGVPAAPTIDTAKPPTPDRPPTPQSAKSGPAASRDAIDDAIDQILGNEGWLSLVEPMIAGLEEKLAKPDVTPERAVEILAEQFRSMDVTALTEKLARATFAARLAGEGDEKLAG